MAPTSRTYARQIALGLIHRPVHKNASLYRLCSTSCAARMQSRRQCTVHKMKEMLQNQRAICAAQGTHYYTQTALICKSARWRYAPELAGHSCKSIPVGKRGTLAVTLTSDAQPTVRQAVGKQRARSPSGKRAHQNDEHDVQYSLHYRR